MKKEGEKKKLLVHDKELIYTGQDPSIGNRALLQLTSTCPELQHKGTHSHAKKKNIQMT